MILQRLEDIQHQDPSQARPYEVIREYKVLRGYNTRPSSEVTAQINFAPPDTKTYKIIQAKGDSHLGERMVRELLDRETDSARRKYTVTRSLGRPMTLFFLGERTSASFLSTFWGCSRSGRINTSCAGKSGWMRAPSNSPTNSRSTRKEPLLLDHDPSSHNAICDTERYVGTCFLRRYRDRPLLGGVHTRWTQYAILRIPIHCAEIAMCDNVWVVGYGDAGELTGFLKYRRKGTFVLLVLC